ncbi:MAG: 5'/3'-nucleotidase SurE [Candidatus Cryptobacteroides sp.]
MNILLTNDDGYRANGIHVLAEIMCQFGNVTVIAPKKHQSGMSMAVSLGFKQVAYKELPEEGPGTWSYLDATPASCIKYGLNFQFLEKKPDVIVSGINHGSNAASASCYSGTLGAAQEGALNGILSIGVSLDSLRPDADFNAVRTYFPDIFRKILASKSGKYGLYYNVNFPDIPASEIKGVRIANQGKGIWVREFREWDPERLRHHGITPEMLGQSSEASIEPGEKLYMMVGDFQDDPTNTDRADHHLMARGYISVCPCHIDSTDYDEFSRQRADIDTDFQK